jgi:hypothetical protein
MHSDVKLLENVHVPDPILSVRVFEFDDAKTGSVILKLLAVNVPLSKRINFDVVVPKSRSLPSVIVPVVVSNTTTLSKTIPFVVIIFEPVPSKVI